MIFPRVWLPEEVDEELAMKTDGLIWKYTQDCMKRNEPVRHISESLVELVTKAGIPVDDMINFLKANNCSRDSKGIKQLEALKASMAKTS